MSAKTIQCRAQVGTPIIASKPWKQGETVSFIYAPAGIHTITAGIGRGDCVTITVENDEQTALDLQESFERLTASNKQEPYADEDHESKKATMRFPADTTKFSWGEIKGEQGVVVCAEPTSYGAEAVNGKVYRSWSPEFATDAEFGKAICLTCQQKPKACECGTCHMGFPEGVKGSVTNPARIVSVNFITGALTNKPAFQAMPPVKAKKAELEDETVQATWSDAAREASAEARRNHAHTLSVEAWMSSHKAYLATHAMEAPTTTEHHNAALEAHMHAESMHLKAAHEFDKIGSRGMAKFHREKASQHGSHASHHIVMKNNPTLRDRLDIPRASKPVNLIDVFIQAGRDNSFIGGYLICGSDGTGMFPTTRGGKPDHKLMVTAWGDVQQFDGPEKEKALGLLRALFASEKLELPLNDEQKIFAGLMAGRTGTTAACT